MPAAYGTPDYENPLEKGTLTAVGQTTTTSLTIILSIAVLYSSSLSVPHSKCV